MRRKVIVLRVILMREDGQEVVLPMAMSDASPRSLHLINGLAADLGETEIRVFEERGFTVFPDDKAIRIPTPVDKIRALGVFPSPECDPAKPGSMRQMVDSGVEKLIALGYTGAGSHVGSADTGVDANHPDLVGRIVNFRDFVENGGTIPKDPEGHGTAVLGLAVGSGASVAKFHGVAPGAAYSHARVLDAEGSGYTSDIIEGIQWLADLGCDVINLSLGSLDTGWTPTTRAVQALCERGILVVVAAGNDGPGTHVEAPANATDCVTAAANDQDGNHCDFSSIGPATGRDGEKLDKPDISAWGENVVMPLSSQAEANGYRINDQYQVMDGTSFACPFVSGCAALYREAVGNVTNFKARIRETAYDDPAITREQEGPGRIDIHAAIARELGVTEVPARGSVEPSVVDSPPVVPPVGPHVESTGCLLALLGIIRSVLR